MSTGLNIDLKSNLSKGSDAFVQFSNNIIDWKNKLDKAVNDLNKKWLGDSADAFKNSWNQIASNMDKHQTNCADASTHLMLSHNSVVDAENKTEQIKAAFGNSATTFVRTVKLELPGLTKGAQNGHYDFEAFAFSFESGYLDKADQIGRDLINAEQGVGKAFDQMLDSVLAIPRLDSSLANISPKDLLASPVPTPAGSNGSTPPPPTGGSGGPPPTGGPSGGPGTPAPDPGTGGPAGPGPAGPDQGGTPPPTGGPAGPGQGGTGTPAPGSTPPPPPIPDNKLDPDALKSTPEGREALKTQEDNHVQIVKGKPGQGSSYDPKTNTLTLDPTDPDMNGTFIDKMAEIDYLHKHKHDLNPQTATSRDAYINAELDKEAYAHAKEFAYDQAIGKQTGSPLQAAYQHGIDAFKHQHPGATQAQLNAAGEKAIRDGIGKTTADGSSTGQTYEQLYGSAFDSQCPSGSSGPSILELMASGKL